MYYLLLRWLQALGITDPKAVLIKALLAGVCFHAYQQVRGRVLCPGA